MGKITATFLASIIVLSTSISAYAEDPLSQTNDFFHEAYANARENDVKKAGPIIVMEGNKAVLLRDGKREEKEFVPALYQIPKEVDHIPLCIFVLLQDQEKLDQKMLANLRHYRELVKAVQPAPEPEPTRQKEIIEKSLLYLDQVIANKSVNQDELTAFCRALTPALMQNADDDVALELGILNKQVQLWKSAMPQSEWDKLHVVIMGAHMPHEGDRVLQYFSWLLNEPKEGMRIIYLENSPDEAHALADLGRHMVDKSIGESFFNDPWRMHRDLLSDSARKYIDTLKAKDD